MSCCQGEDDGTGCTCNQTNINKNMNTEKPERPARIVKVFGRHIDLDSIIEVSDVDVSTDVFDDEENVLAEKLLKIGKLRVHIISKYRDNHLIRKVRVDTRLKLEGEAYEAKLTDNIIKAQEESQKQVDELVNLWKEWVEWKDREIQYGSPGHCKGIL